MLFKDQYDQFLHDHHSGSIFNSSHADNYGLPTDSQRITKTDPRARNYGLPTQSDQQSLPKETKAGIPTPVLIIGGLAAAYMLFGKSTSRKRSKR